MLSTDLFYKPRTGADKTVQSAHREVHTWQHRVWGCCSGRRLVLLRGSTMGRGSRLGGLRQRVQAFGGLCHGVLLVQTPRIQIHGRALGFPATGGGLVLTCRLMRILTQE